MIRWKFTFDKDEEQEWLNDWCQNGWAMTKFFMGVVTFVPCQPGEFIYQIDMIPGRFLQAHDYEGYVIFMDEMGIEVLQRWGRWVYLRKRAEDGPFDLYTDTESKIALYRRIRSLFFSTLVLELLCSSSVWNLLRQFPDDWAARGLAGFYIVMAVTLLRAVWRCSWKIKELSRQG